MSRAQAMHDNSIASYRVIEPKITGRKREILDWLTAHGARTDREVMKALGYRDMNAVRPRITELIRDKELEEYRSVYDAETDRIVRVVGLPRVQRSLFS